MKESAHSEKFRAAVTKAKKDIETGGGDMFLSALRDAAQALDDMGMAVSLEVAPGLSGSERAKPEGKDVIANAVLTMGGQRTDWLFYRDSDYAGRVALAAYLGDAQIGEFTSYRHDNKWSEPYVSGDGGLKGAIIDTIIKASAESDAYAEYNVNSSRPSTRVTVDKPFPVSRPLQLKEPKP